MQRDFSDAAYAAIQSYRLEQYDFAGKGKPCGGSHISATYTCRLGQGGMSWDEAAGQVGPNTRAALPALLETIERVKPQKLQDMWRAEVDSMMSEAPKTHHSLSKKKGEAPEPYTDEEIDKAMAGRAKGVQRLIENGYPEKVQFRDGGVEDAPPGMVPFVTATGQGGWIHPTNGLKYNTSPDGTATQNRAGLFDSARRAQDIEDFRESQRRSGQPWPIQELPPLDGRRKMSGEEVFNSLSEKEINAIMLNGIPRGGTSPAAQMKDYYKENPEEGRQRVREICDRWAAQNGRSGVSGRPISIPGLDPKPGEEKSTVDHFGPASSGKGMNAREFRKALDNGKNFLLTEEGPNSQRQDAPWDQWADNKLPKLKSMASPTKEQLAKIPDWTGSPKLQQPKPPRKSDKSPAADAQRAAAKRTADRIKEIERESKAAQRAKYKKMQQEAKARGDADAADYWNTAIGNLG